VVARPSDAQSPPAIPRDGRHGSYLAASTIEQRAAAFRLHAPNGYAPAGDRRTGTAGLTWRPPITRPRGGASTTQPPLRHVTMSTALPAGDRQREEQRI
jgi:hypothetical protein